jgi:hypothetical protein
MPEATVAVLTPWENFYVIIGAAAASLTGLMFIVITLIASTRQPGSINDAFSAFGTPTVVHFCAALLIAAILSAPWPVLWAVGVLLGLTGLGGMLYAFIVMRRFQRQNSYEPVLEDWVWYVILPFVAYTALLLSALLLPAFAPYVLFIIAAATVLFLFIGIHNSWDSVTYTTLVRSNTSIGEENRDKQAI